MMMMMTLLCRWRLYRHDNGGDEYNNDNDEVNDDFDDNNTNDGDANANNNGDEEVAEVYDYAGYIISCNTFNIVVSIPT